MPMEQHKSSGPPSRSHLAMATLPCTIGTAPHGVNEAKLSAEKSPKLGDDISPSAKTLVSKTGVI